MQKWQIILLAPDTVEPLRQQGVSPTQRKRKLILQSQQYDRGEVVEKPVKMEAIKLESLAYHKTVPNGVMLTFMVSTEKRNPALVKGQCSVRCNTTVIIINTLLQ